MRRRCATALGLAAELWTISTVAEQTAGGQIRIERLPEGARDDLGRLRASFNQMAASLEGMVGQLQESSTTLTSTSRELDAAFQQVAVTAQVSADGAGRALSASQDLADGMNAVAAAVEQMNATIAEISSNAQMATNNTKRTVQRVEQTQATIALLGSASNEIGAVTSIAAAVEEQAATVPLIANSVDDTNLATAQIAETMQAAAEGTESSKRAATDSQTSAVAVRNVAVTLGELLGQYH
jgi:methyl-accepting chemotaxis protein